MPAAVPHFAHPFRVVNGAVATVEQDSRQEIETCVEAILMTLVGSRIEEPEFGVPDELFATLPPDPNIDELIAAIERWEPRVRSLARAEVDELVLRVRIEIQGGD